MFCCQCEQAAGGRACISRGVCGKTAEVANMQDLLIYQLKGIAIYAGGYLEQGQDVPKEYIAFIENALIQTVTNVNFEAADHLRMLKTSKELKEKIRIACPKIETDCPEALFILNEDRNEVLKDAVIAGIMYDPAIAGEIRSLREAIKLGLKGIAAYSHQARVCGYYDNRVDHFFCTALAALADDSLNGEELAGLVLESGEKAAMAISLLDQANNQGQIGMMLRDQAPVGNEMIAKAAMNGDIRRFFLLEAVMMLTRGEVVILNVPRWFGRIAAGRV